MGGSSFLSATPGPEPPGPPLTAVTSALFSGSCALATALRDCVSPTANVAATVPKVTASTIAIARTGCAKGLARP